MGDDLSINRWGSLLRQIRFVSHIFVFPLYNSQTYAHDIAVIRTSRDFDATETFKAVPRALFPPLVGKSCQLAGWGAIDENKVWILDLNVRFFIIKILLHFRTSLMFISCEWIF
jgi:hypothetical protein